LAFKALCDFLEACSADKVKARRGEKLKRFLADCRTLVGQNESLFPVARLLLPQVSGRAQVPIVAGC